MTNKQPDVVYFKGKLMYPRFWTPDIRYEPKYTTDLLLDAAGVEKAKQYNINIRMNERYQNQFDGYDGSYIRADRKVASFNGDRQPPEVKDTQKRDIPSDTAIGNGSDAEIRVLVKKEFAKKTLTPEEATKKWGGYPIFLTAVQISNLVPYERKNGDAFGADDEDPAAYHNVRNDLDDEIPF